METIRDEIADCCEKAYGSLPVKDAARILFLEDVADVELFVETRGWVIADGVVQFPAKAVADAKILSGTIIERSLTYARELERIV